MRPLESMKMSFKSFSLIGGSGLPEILGVKYEGPPVAFEFLPLPYQRFWGAVDVAEERAKEYLSLLRARETQKMQHIRARARIYLVVIVHIPSQSFPGGSFLKCSHRSL